MSAILAKNRRNPNQKKDLIEKGVKGVHFFTLNKYQATVRRSRALRGNW